MSFFKKLLTRQKVLLCPACKKRLRVPVFSGKTIRITCPHCSQVFELSFVNPISGLISGKLKIKDLTLKQKMYLVFLLINLIIIISIIIFSIMKKDNFSREKAPTIIEQEKPLGI